MKKYDKFRQNDIEKSKILALKLEIPEKDIGKIEHWFERLLSEHEKADYLKDNLKTETELECQFAELCLKTEPQSNKYILVKLLNYNNIFQSGFLKSTHIARLTYLLYGNLIPRFINVVKPKYSVVEFIYLSEYLKYNFFVSPNGELLENILIIEKSNKIFQKATIKQRLELTANLIHIIKENEFHHSLICFKKLLNLLTTEDKNVIEFLKNFKVNNNQGCYSIINKILNLVIHNDLWIDFEFKKELIHFFDTAKGAKPNEKWLIKLAQLNSKIGSGNIRTIADEVSGFVNKDNHYFNETSYWSDNIAKRFLKSAKWIKEHDSKPYIGDILTIV